jgi:peptidoglycan biosynthesis protein MviN/MurJ (putative lipid II flippase)
MAALPGMAHAAHDEDGTTFGSQWRQGLSYVLIASLPLLVLLGLNSGPTASLLTAGEPRHAGFVGPLTACLAIAAVAQLVGGIHDLGRQALFARLDDRIPRRASEIAFGVTIAVAGVALLLPADGTRLVWLVMANLVGELAAAGTVLIRLRRTILPERFLEPRALAAALVATAAIVPVAAGLRWTEQINAHDRSTNLVFLAVGAPLALGIYVLVLRMATRRIQRRRLIPAVSRSPAR